MLPVLIITSAAIIYILIVGRLGFGIPCLFHRITGFKCPGCGITGLFTALSRFDLKAAYASNQFVFITLPFLGFEFAFMCVNFIKRLKNPSWNERLLIVYVVLLIGWGFVRNIR